IVILGVLAGIVVFAVNGITDRGVNAACKADINSVQVAAEAYYAKNGDYAEFVPETAGHTSLVPNFLHAAPNGGDNYTIHYTVNAAVGTNPKTATVTGTLNKGNPLTDPPC